MPENIIKELKKTNDETEIAFFYSYIDKLRDIGDDLSQGTGIHLHHHTTFDEGFTKEMNNHVYSIYFTIPQNLNNELSTTEINDLVNDLFKNVNNLKYLNYIHIHSTAMTIIPVDILKVKTMRTLSLIKNSIKKIDGIGYLTNLKKLILNFNNIIELSEEIGNLGKLDTLEVHHNELVSLPKSFTKLKKLEILNLGYNKLTELPEDIDKLEMLSQLLLRSNKIKYFPDSIIKNRKLDFIDLKDNPWHRKDQTTQVKNWVDNFRKIREESMYYGEFHHDNSIFNICTGEYYRRRYVGLDCICKK